MFSLWLGEGYIIGHLVKSLGNDDTMVSISSYRYQQEGRSTGIECVNLMAAHLRLSRSSHGIFLLSSTFQTCFILGLCKASWYTGSAFTSYFHHNWLLFPSSPCNNSTHVLSPPLSFSFIVDDGILYYIGQNKTSYQEM